MNLVLEEMTKNNNGEFWSNSDHQTSSYKKRVSMAQKTNANGAEHQSVGRQHALLSLSKLKVASSSQRPAKKESPLSSYLREYENSKINVGSSTRHKNDIEEGVALNIDSSNTQKKNKPAAKMYPNDPHPLLELPPLYFILKHFPCLLENVKKFYKFRWNVSYPLQKRIPFSNLIRKAGIHMTWGELIILIPFIWMLISGTIYTFVFPSVRITGYFSRLPLLFAVGTAVRNSFITFLIGMPFERELWYHKLAGRIAFVNGILHTYVAYIKPVAYTNPVSIEFDEKLKDFAFGNTINTSGTIILILIGGIFVSSLPYFRRKCFEVFYYVHVIFVAVMIVCAFYHSGNVVPIVASLFWGVDLIIRKMIMAGARYPKKATIRIVSETVVEICFPKTKHFDYNPGQFVYIAVPELSIFEWHPFSLSSCPMQRTVTMHIRKVGTWTESLHDLAKKKQEISILIEGPYGSPCVDITDNEYKNILLFSGGIGITPIQSISNQLVYEYTERQRDLKHLKLIWIERDPVLVENVDITRHSSSHHVHAEASDIQSLCSCGSTDIASALLTTFPVDKTPDHQLESEYRSQDDDDDNDNSSVASENMNEEAIFWKSIADEDTVIEKAYKRSSLPGILDLQVYLTSNDKNQEFTNLPFVRLGRPDVKEIFLQMREEALANKEKRVAVYVCAPARLAQLCRNACVKYSDECVIFDYHVEGPE